MTNNSPCVSRCNLNNNDYCTGCKRSCDEIREWRTYTEDQKKQIITKLKHRNIDD